jgi:hypothetical protein
MRLSSTVVSAWFHSKYQEYRKLPVQYKLRMVDEVNDNVSYITIKLEEVGKMVCNFLTATTKCFLLHITSDVGQIRISLIKMNDKSIRMTIEFISYCFDKSYIWCVGSDPSIKALFQKAWNLYQDYKKPMVFHKSYITSKVTGKATLDDFLKVNAEVFFMFQRLMRKLKIA